MQKKYDLAVFIGRFQPFHNGHSRIIEAALQQADRVLVLVGGSHGALRPRNPWTFEQRKWMITGTHGDIRVTVAPLRDFVYRDDRWVEEVQRAVAMWAPRTAKIALAGRSKDESSYYLNLFPQWGEIRVTDGIELDATYIRGKFFQRELAAAWKYVPQATKGVLQEYGKSPEFRRMWAEWEFIQKYQSKHDNGEYARNNVTGDAVVIQSGHVLMTRRRALPGKSMMALPGGHVGRREKPLDAAFRELVEETCIKVPMSVLRGSLVEAREFNDPYRSDLCRTYTTAALIRLTNEGTKLAKVKGADDAASAFWVPLAELDERQCFDDHWHIIDSFIGLA